jgi:hypothetical protein
MKTKNRPVIIICIAIVSLMLASCLKSLLCVTGDGVFITESRRSPAFDEIENSTSFDIIYKVSDTTGIRIDCEQNIMQYIETNVYNGCLEVTTSPGSICLDYNTRPVITVSSPSLVRVVNAGSGTFLGDKMNGDDLIVKLSGSGEVAVDHAVCNTIDIKLSGSGNIDLKELFCSTADITISGSGDMTSGGNCESSHLKITGSGNIYCKDLHSTTVSAIISGSGNIFIRAEEYLNGLLSGSGNIFYRGDPEIDQTISGSGRIIKYK